MINEVRQSFKYRSTFYVFFISGKVGQPFVSIYSASKFALDGFFSGLRQELKMRDCDISVTLCVLGFIGKYYHYIILSCLSAVLWIFFLICTNICLWCSMNGIKNNFIEMKLLSVNNKFD